MNDVKIDKRCDLKPNDVIGLGCGRYDFNGPDEKLSVKKDEMFLYRLIEKTDNISIEISDDDDNTSDDEDKNGIVKTEHVERTTDANRLVTNSSPQRNNGISGFFILF